MAIAGIQTLGLEMAIGDLRRRLDEQEANSLASITGRDLDETRRLLYMVLMSRYTNRYVLAGTLVNALCHHNLMLDVDETIKHVSNLLNFQSSEQDGQLLRDLIKQLSVRMADEG